MIVLRAELARTVGVGGEGRDELLAGRRPEAAVRGDAIAEAEERGLVEERDDAVGVDGGDEQVDAGRADVDGRLDRGALGDLDGFGLALADGIRGVRPPGTGIGPDVGGGGP